MKKSPGFARLTNSPKYPAIVASTLAEQEKALAEVRKGRMARRELSPIEKSAIKEIKGKKP